MTEPVRMMPSEEGVDSPLLGDEPFPAAMWNDWCDIVADRVAGRPTPLRTLVRAVDAGEPTWNLWWDREHPRGVLTHRAALLGLSLVAFCGYSTPARPELQAWEMGDRAIRDSRRTYCSVCLRADPWLRTA